MKLEIRVDNHEYINIEWPDGIPLPNAGDEVVMQLKPEGVTMFIVENRFFSIGTGIDGLPLAQVRILGRDVPTKD